MLLPKVWVFQTSAMLVTHLGLFLDLHVYLLIPASKRSCVVGTIVVAAYTGQQ